ncbi:YwqJ-related putative deaminase [Dactylosporangium sp. NPDC051541]|uniref:YwqJ-related putative deaminase n=1 Tax=Dactylosporangium sp. NPDC051541 TaxID=3363977 RepID=UPI0037B9182D
MTRATSGRRLPLTAGALLVGDTVFQHTSVRGDTPPELHALIRRFLHELPVESRERYAGNCAEMVLVSDRLHAAERLYGGTPLTPAAARAELWGARLSLVHIREHGDPKHGTPAAPCRTCAALLDWLGIEVGES